MFTVGCTVKKNTRLRWWTPIGWSHDAVRRRKQEEQLTTAFPLSPHNKSTYFPKLSNTAGVSAATPTIITNVTPSRSGAQLKAFHRRNCLSSLERESALCVRVDGVFMCLQTLPSFHCYLPVQSITHGAERRQWESGVNWAETPWPYVELCASVKAQFSENNIKKNSIGICNQLTMLLICQNYKWLISFNRKQMKMKEGKL